MENDDLIELLERTTKVIVFKGTLDEILKQIRELRITEEIYKEEGLL